MSSLVSARFRQTWLGRLLRQLRLNRRRYDRFERRWQQTDPLGYWRHVDSLLRD